MIKTVIITGNPQGIRLAEFASLASDKDVALWASQFGDMWDGKITHHEGNPPIRTLDIAGEILLVKENDETTKTHVFFGYDAEKLTYSFRVVSGLVLIASGGGAGLFARINNVFDLEKEIRRCAGCADFFFTQAELAALLSAMCDRQTIVFEKEWISEK